MKIGFIGFGHMAMALAEGFLKGGSVQAEEIFATARHFEKLKQNAAALGVTALESEEALTERADLVFLATPPAAALEYLSKIGEKPVISVAAGTTFEAVKDRLAGRMQYMMPNLPAAVGKGVFLLEEANNLQKKEQEALRSLLSTAGEVVTLPTRLMAAGGALSGCGPAFMDMVMDAFADAGVRWGLEKETAVTLAAGAMAGAAALQKATGTPPALLKDDVCSPGGITIRGVASLEETGLRHSFHAAVDAMMRKDR